MSRLKHIFRGLDRAFKSADKIDGELNQLKWVIFSDHHRGIRDGADDFLRCESTYTKALSYYYQKGFHLMLLGDVEEFWENRFRRVLNSYPEVLKLEKKFFDGQRLTRIWGNHDDNWRFQSVVSKYLGWIFPKMKVYESVRLRITKNAHPLGEIFFVHGHQGTLASERWARISRFFVRYFWRTYQQVFKKPLSTPSTNIKLRSVHDHAMYDWASGKRGLVLICGHTHQPVFMSLTHADIVSYKIDEMELRQANEPDRDYSSELKQLREDLSMIEKQKQGTHLSSDPKHTQPCYFNSGCCSFSDGDISGLEITAGMINLVKWTRNQADDYQVLESAYLEKVLEKCWDQTV